jgi:tetratricopeptide (TPR) repeat protein
MKRRSLSDSALLPKLPLIATAAPRRAQPVEPRIRRALAGQRPEADVVDMAALAALEPRYRLLLAEAEASQVADPTSDPPPQPRRRRRLGAELSRAYCALGLSCLESEPALAHEILGRAARAAPREDSQLRATCNSHLGAAAAAAGRPTAAMRYMRRAAALDRGLQPEVRARVRLNLCAVLSQMQEPAEALFLAQEAAALLAQPGAGGGGGGVGAGAGGAADGKDGVGGGGGSGSRNGGSKSCNGVHNAGSSGSGVRTGGASPGGDEADRADRGVLRAIALHNASVCLEHMSQFSRAHDAARAATRAAAASLPPDAPLLLRLQRVERELSAKEAKQLHRTGAPVGCSRAQREAQRALPPRLADPAFRPKFSACVREPTKAEAEAAAFNQRMSCAEAQQLRRKEPLSKREPIATVATTRRGLDLVSGVSPVRRTALDAPNSKDEADAGSKWGPVGRQMRLSLVLGRGERGAGSPDVARGTGPARGGAGGRNEAEHGTGLYATGVLPPIVGG